MSYQIELADEARQDVLAILEWSVARFGESVREGYEALIQAAFERIADSPDTAGSHERDDLRSDVRSLHLRTCRSDVLRTVRRITNPRQFVIYRQVGETVQVVRLLHDAMDLPNQRIPQ